MRIVLVENAQVNGLLAVRPPPAPRLEGTCTFQFGLLIQIVGIENQRLAPRIENPAIRLLGFARAGHVIDFRNIEIAGAHQFADIAVMAQEFIVLFESSLLLLKFRRVRSLTLASDALARAAS